MAESFFATLKTEFYYRRVWPTEAGAKLAVGEWIEDRYNRRRRHSSIGQISPVTFEMRHCNQTAANQHAAQPRVHRPGSGPVAANKIHRGHAIIEQVHADPKHSALAHLPSGKFCANAAWLVLAVMALNLTRTAANLTGPRLAKATTTTVRRTPITVPARIASSARRVTLHLPQHWPWETGWTTISTPVCGPPASSH